MKKLLCMLLTLIVVATMVTGLCTINVSAAYSNLPNFKVEFANASGAKVTSAKAGTTITANIYLPAATYQTAAVTLIPADDVVFSNIVGANGITFAALNILTTPAAVAGQAQAKATSAFTIDTAPYFSVDVTVPADATAGEPIVLFTIKSGSAATCDLGDGNKMYTIPTDGHEVQVLDGFTADHATYTGNNAFDFGVDEDYLEEYFADKQVRIFNEEETKYEDFDIDEVTVSPIFEKNIAGTFESAVTLTVKKESFTDDTPASSDEDVVVNLSISISKYDLEDGYDFNSGAADLIYEVNTEGGQKDEAALIADFNAKGYNGTITVEEFGYEETVKIVAVSADKALDLTKVSDIESGDNVVTLTLGVELLDDTNLDGTVCVDPVKAYVYENVILGDVNEDGFVNDEDWIIIFNHVSNIIEYEGLPSWDDEKKYDKKTFTAADVNEDGFVNDEDWIIIFNYVSYIPSGVSSPSTIAVIDTVGTAKVDGDEVPSVTYWKDGEKNTAYTDVDLDSDITDALKSALAGELWKFAVSEDGSTITDAKRIAYYYNGAEFGRLKGEPGEAGSVRMQFEIPSTMVAYRFGPAVDYSSSMNIKIGQWNPSTGLYDFDETESIKGASANVYVVDPARKNNQVYVGTTSDCWIDKDIINRSKAGEDRWKIVEKDGRWIVPADEQALGLIDFVAAVEYYGDVTDIVIYKTYDLGKYKFEVPDFD